MTERAWRRPPWRDVALGVAATVLALVELWLAADSVEGALSAHLALNLLVLPALAIRRTWPLGSALLAAVSLALQPFVGSAPVAAGFLVLLFLLASLGWYATLSTGVTGVAAVVAGALVFDLTADEVVVADLVVNLVLLVGTWAAGRAMRVTSDRRIAAELAADRTARHAVQEERARISRDLHDSLAHALTVITLQAGSAGERTADRQAGAALGAIATEGRDALAEMHRFLRLLGDDQEEQPGLGHLDGLVSGLRRSGLDVDVRVTVDDLPHGLSAAVYRTVQEGLTNVVRHSDARVADVAVDRVGCELVAVVASTGGPRQAALPGSGRGLVGLRERLGLLGGTLESAATADGWRLEARIPLPGESR